MFSKKKSHLRHLTDLFETLIRNGLKISPRKCKLFKTSLLYMGHQVSIIEGIPHITQEKVELMLSLNLIHQRTLRIIILWNGELFVNFMKDLQMKLIPIYQLTKKGVPFHWGELQQKAFEMFKEGHMVLVSDISKIACGSALYQEQK